jgi:hypothetical protein
MIITGLVELLYISLTEYKPGTALKRDSINSMAIISVSDAYVISMDFEHSGTLVFFPSLQDIFYVTYFSTHTHTHTHTHTLMIL